MRLYIYNILVNRVPGIRDRYHKYHDGFGKGRQLLSWLYLLWLNFAYYVLHIRRLAQAPGIETYEQKQLNIDSPESQLCKRHSAEEMIALLSNYDIISFDIFDTMIFRPFSDPTDLFYIVGQKLNYMDFKRIRIECEILARRKKYEVLNSYEVDINEIWQEVELQTGLNAKEGIAAELETEFELCYANSYMQQVYDALASMGKHIVFTSDMYLPSQIMQQLLEKCGYKDYEWIYVSCDEGKSKGVGDLYQQMISDQRKLYGEAVKIIHVGDNENSDYKRALAEGIAAYNYKNVNANSLIYRAYDLSPVIGGAYRGIINNRLYSGAVTLTLNQEYGFIYGGLFILGYCHYIHEYCKNHSIEKVFFLSRDGEIIKKAYDYLYPDENTEYVYISRIASLKWAAEYMKYDYIRKMVRHKLGTNKSFIRLLEEMEQEELVRLLPEYGLRPETRLTQSNIDEFVKFLNDNWQRIIDKYSAERELARQYYSQKLGTASSVVAVDIGWAGSGFVALKNLFEKEWKLDCSITGLVAGTNTANSFETDMSETFLLDGSLASYLYSAADNRDLWKKHNPNTGYNLYFELLTSSPQPSFRGFKKENGAIAPVFSEPEPNQEGIMEIWDGIMTFITDYKEHFEKYPYMFNISGRDAYAPMLLAASYNERYLKKIYESFNLTVGVE